MDTCSRAGMGMMSLSCLCRLVLRALRRIRAFSTASPETYKITDDHVRPPSTQEAAVICTESPELPVDILMDIFALLEITDLIRAGSVCSTWHAAYTSLCSHGSCYQRRIQTPCILYTSESDADDVACLYSLAENRVYKLTLPAPPIRSRQLIGCSNGWLVTADESSELHIVNPITGEQVALPPVATIEQVKPIFDDAGVLQRYELLQYSGEEVYAEPSTYGPSVLRDYLFFKAFVFFDCDGAVSSSSMTGGYVVVLIHNPFKQLSFARAGDSKWTWLPPSAEYEDCIYMDGVLYAVTATSEIDAFDLSGPTILRKAIMEGKKNYIYEYGYITQTPLGDLLLAWREQELKDEEGSLGYEDYPEPDPSEFIEETGEGDPSEIIEEMGEGDPERDIASEFSEETDENDPELDPSEFIDQMVDSDLECDNSEFNEEMGEGSPEHDTSEFSEEMDEDNREYGPLEYSMETRRITLYKLDMDRKEIAEIDSLDGLVLVLGHGQSICLSAVEYPQLKANHVYLTDDERGMAPLSKGNSRDICVLNLGSNSIEQIVPPCCWCSWPAPIWITPNTTKMS